MKRHTQFTGIRNWYGGDFVDLEAEPLKILDGFFSEFGNFIISGCRITQSGSVYNVSPGIVALQGKGPDGEEVKIVAQFEGAEDVALPLYLTLSCETLKDTYVDGNLQPIAYIYKAVGTGIRPGMNCVEISSTSNVRFNDVLQDALHRFISDAERTLWNGKETPEGAQAKANAALISAKAYADTKETTTGAQAKANAALASAKAYADTAVANLVGSSPAALDTLQELANALGNDPNFATTVLNKLANKVDKVAGKGLSTNDYTDADKTKAISGYTFDYIVDSSAKLKALHLNPNATAVLIRKGHWTYNTLDGKGIELHSNVKLIVGEEGSELSFYGVTSTACLIGNSNCRADHVTVICQSTAYSCFQSFGAMNYCVGSFNKNCNIQVFKLCDRLYGCIAINTESTLCGEGFFSCYDLTYCSSEGAIKIGFDYCHHLNRCKTTRESNGGFTSFNGCSNINGCEGWGTMTNCMQVLNSAAWNFTGSYYSPNSNSEYSCNNTMSGGWNTKRGA